MKMIDYVKEQDRMIHTLLVLTDTSHLFVLRFTYNTDAKKEDDISISKYYQLFNPTLSRPMELIVSSRDERFIVVKRTH